MTKMIRDTIAHVHLRNTFFQSQDKLNANFGIAKNVYYNATYAVLEASFMTLPSAATGSKAVKFMIGTASVDLTFNVVPAPIDNTTNLTVINRGKNVAKMCQKCGKMWQKCAMS
jgi:hypothetical protein